MNAAKISSEYAANILLNFSKLTSRPSRQKSMPLSTSMALTSSTSTSRRSIQQDHSEGPRESLPGPGRSRILLQKSTKKEALVTAKSRSTSKTPRKERIQGKGSWVHPNFRNFATAHLLNRNYRIMAANPNVTDEEGFTGLSFALKKQH